MFLQPMLSATLNQFLIFGFVFLIYIAKVMGAPMNVISDSRVLPLHLIRESLMHYYLTIVMSIILP